MVCMKALLTMVQMISIADCVVKTRECRDISADTFDASGRLVLLCYITVIAAY